MRACIFQPGKFTCWRRKRPKKTRNLTNGTGSASDVGDGQLPLAVGAVVVGVETGDGQHVLVRDEALVHHRSSAVAVACDALHFARAQHAARAPVVAGVVGCAEAVEDLFLVAEEDRVGGGPAVGEWGACALVFHSLEAGRERGGVGVQLKFGFATVGQLPIFGFVFSCGWMW